MFVRLSHYTGHCTKSITVTLMRIGGAPLADVRLVLAMEIRDGNMILIVISYSLQWK